MSAFPHFPGSQDEKPPTITTATTSIDDKVKLAATSLADCVMGNYTFTVAGVFCGSILKLRQNSWRPFIIFTMIGSVSDLYYGYNAVCIQQRDDYTKALEAQKKQAINKNNKSST